MWLVRRVSQLPCCCPEPLAVVVTDPNELDSDTAVRNIRSDESVTHCLAVTAWQGESDADPSPDLERMARLDKRAPDPKDSQRAAGRLVSIEPALLDLCPDHGAEFYARVSPMNSCTARRGSGQKAGSCGSFLLTQETLLENVGEIATRVAQDVENTRVGRLACRINGFDGAGASDINALLPAWLPMFRFGCRVTTSVWIGVRSGVYREYSTNEQ